MKKPIYVPVSTETIDEYERFFFHTNPTRNTKENADFYYYYLLLYCIFNIIEDDEDHY